MTQPGADSRPQDSRADVELRLPADNAYVSVLRTTTAGLAARLDFTLDDIEDLRIAVGEACALVMPEATPGTDLTCRYVIGDRMLTVSVEVEASDPQPPDESSFAWQVLKTLAADAATRTGAGTFAIDLSVRATDLEPGL